MKIMITPDTKNLATQMVTLLNTLNETSGQLRTHQNAIAGPDVWAGSSHDAGTVTMDELYQLLVKFIETHLALANSIIQTCEAHEEVDAQGARGMRAS